ncbi:hypothetical protein ES703_117421 [subsurface metagenome]
MRLISGSEQNLDVERRWMEVALKSQGEDGLIYTPLQGRPWGLRGAKLMAEGARGGIRYCNFVSLTFISWELKLGYFGVNVADRISRFPISKFLTCH